MPMNHAAVITTITDALKTVPEIRALFLSGSYGTGHADAYSDIDFVLVTPDGSTDAIVTLWRKAVEQTGDIILWWDNKPHSVLINAITVDWTRTDVIIQKPEQMASRAQDALKPLFDHDDIYSSLAAKTPYNPRPPARFTHQIEEFIRIIGLTPLALGRKEYLNGVLGVQFLRNALVDLLIEENEVADRGGILHLNRLITDDQKELLMAMPTPAPTADGIVAANLAYAAAYLPRARKMAAQIGADWPELFEAATWAQLKDTLGLQRPYNSN